MARQPFISQAARRAGITTEWGYQQWLARQRGFPTYREQRATLGTSIVQNLVNLAVANGMSRNEAIASVRQWYRDQDYHGPGAKAGSDPGGAKGRRKHYAIAWAVENGLVPAGLDDYPDIDY